jgi:hypothetical protein
LSGTKKLSGVAQHDAHRDADGRDDGADQVERRGEATDVVVADQLDPVGAALLGGNGIGETAGNYLKVESVFHHCCS